jgi:multisubunit Na+/H+ antiporter MnhB subunit
MMLRPAAKLDGVRLHDLRHSFASVGAAHGLSLAIVGKLLGHATPGGGVPQTCHVALLGVASLGVRSFRCPSARGKSRLDDDWYAVLVMLALTLLFLLAMASLPSITEKPDGTISS